MIYYPVTYHRQFQNDLPKVDESSSDVWKKCQQMASAALPLLSLSQRFRGPLSVGMSGLRSVCCFSEMFQQFKQGDLKEGAFQFFQASLATLSLGLYFFQPVYGFIASSVSDFLFNSRNLIQHIQLGNYQQALEALSFMTLDLLFLGSLCYGAIEITVACMVLQIAIDLYLSLKHFKNGDYFEGVCQFILGAAHMNQAIPQMKLLQWTRNPNLEFTAELKRDRAGFVYLDIPDEYVRSLYALYKEQGMKLPPYFGPRKAGAHVSVILKEERVFARQLPPGAIGTKYNFRISHVSTVKPGGWDGAKNVHMLTVVCPELEGVRTGSGLAPRIHGHDFHLTFGIS